MKPANGFESEDQEDFLALGPPPDLPKKRGSELFSGPRLDPVRIIRASDPEQLEIIAEYWLRESLEKNYHRIVRNGGSGDLGRDVIAYETSDSKGPWHNFQCKRFASAKLRPADIWLELGKLVYWVTMGSYSIPETYSFVAPLGATAKVNQLLSSPEKLREELRKNWNEKCGHLCELSTISAALAEFDFPEFAVIDGGAIVDDLKGSAVYPALFGGGLAKPRPTDTPPPDEIDEALELGYINALVDAYNDDAELGVTTAGEAFAHDIYGTHLRISRKEFYCAESLREFSKDVLVDDDSYGVLQEQIHDGIIHKLLADYESAYKRALEVCAHSTGIGINDHPLASELTPADRAGMCHQLANDGRITWVK